VTEKFTFFWSGPFSQWHPSEFWIGGVEYNCAEQWMMAEKARLFKDEHAERDIMTTHRPNEQKAIGRHVKNFDLGVWNQNAKLIVYRGNWAKYTQNFDLATELIKTQGTTIVEASPYDHIWGVGLEAGDPRINDRANWRGLNWLGEVLMAVRGDMK